MSPEMVRALPVDRRSDVFALGAVLHELLTGERCFTAASELGVLERVRAAQVRPPSSRNPSVPPALDAIVLKALAREPDARFAWASELRDALEPFARIEPAADGRAVAQLLARTFPEGLRAEGERLERLRRAVTAPAGAPTREGR
jgi:serine/threonine-protein kinase